MCVCRMAKMQTRYPAGTKTVGDVLWFSASDTLSGAEQPRNGTARLVPPDMSDLPPRQLALLPTPQPHKPRLTAVVHRRSQHSSSVRSTSSRRPLDEALFCALIMESEAEVLRRLRAHGLAALMDDFQTVCSNLSLHNVRSEEFTFMCAAVLQCPVRPRDGEIVFAFLRGNRTPGGGISVVELLERLRTLFEPLEVLCALQLKCLLETRRLDYCNVALNELERAGAGLRSLLINNPLRDKVDAEWERLVAELLRLQVHFAVPVPTFRLLVRRSARALRSVVRALGWDGKIRWRLCREGEDEVSDDGVQEPLRAFDVSRLTACTVLDLCNEAGVQDSGTALLSAVTKTYNRGLTIRTKSPVAAEGLSPALRATVRATRHASPFGSPNSAADPTHPRFKADLYAVLPASPSCTAARMTA
ncbi:hypothetical protein Q4I32_002254 [Leishmania shawi]|uniref:Uncharacterized protein n=2 Tax=Leishmania guyanensis species complex TaxID=38579 RepID=A0AAW3C765_9TRYP